MCKDINNFIPSCITCKQTKYVPKPPIGLLQPIPPPSANSDGFYRQFASDQGQMVILVANDVFLKPHILKLYLPIFPPAKQLNFSHKWSARYKEPHKYHHHRDPIFISKF